MNHTLNEQNEKQARRWIVRIGEDIRGKRLAKKLTMEAAADRVGMNWRHWQKIEHGEVPMKMTTLFKVAKALDAHPATLLEID